ncbi:hypothetical protein [Neptuniibacter sp. QD37_11]|uniref:hypothetical protein n=1 Tax=Neptuniibacter sp. QD37_11 TaxID=3398209 RepID=UPI0039F58F62
MFKFSSLLVAMLISAPVHAEILEFDPTAPRAKKLADIEAAEKPVATQSKKKVTYYKVTAIFSNDTAPSALVNNRWVSINDRVGSAVVESIAADRVTLRVGKSLRVIKMKQDSDFKHAVRK